MSVNFRPEIQQLRAKRREVASALEKIQNELDRLQKELDRLDRVVVQVMPGEELLPPPPDVIDFQIGTATGTGDYDPFPQWDLLNNAIIWEWGCFLPKDVSNLGGVTVFFFKNNRWIPTVNTSEWITPKPEMPYQDSFSISGSLLTRQAEDWIFRCCVFDKARGEWKKNPDGTPAGPEIKLVSHPPNRGIKPENIADEAVGPGLVKSANELLVNIGNVLRFEAGKIEVNLGAGIGEVMGQIYVKVAQGLGFDEWMHIRIPPYSVGDDLLEKGPIIDAQRIVNYAIGAMQLEYAPIINSERIVDLAVLREKVGFAAIGAAQIAHGSIENAHIRDVTVDKLKAGTAFFDSDVIFRQSGEFRVLDGRGIYVSPGTVTAKGFATVDSPGWVIDYQSISSPHPSTYVVAGEFRAKQVPSVSGVVEYLDHQGQPRYLYVNGGVIGITLV